MSESVYFSKRSRLESEQSELSRARADALRAGGDFVDLTHANPTALSFPYDFASIAEALAEGSRLPYDPDPLGPLSARIAVCRELESMGLSSAPERVLLTASTSEAYSFLLHLFCEPGDELLVPSPSYPLFDQLAALASVTLVPYALRYEAGWYIDTDSVPSLISPRTRAIVVINPNNPTGSYVAEEELYALAAHGLPIISDEVFFPYRLRSQSRPASGARSVLELPPDVPAIMLGGLSKYAGLPQAKLAWTVLHGPPSFVHEAMGRLEWMGDTFLSPSGFVSQAAPRLLASSRLVREAILARLRSNLAVVRAATDQTAVTLLSVDGGFSCMLRLPRTADDEQWALQFLQEDAVYTHPGGLFGVTEAPMVVLSLLCEPAPFRQGVERLVASVKRHVQG